MVKSRAPENRILREGETPCPDCGGGVANLHIHCKSGPRLRTKANRKTTVNRLIRGSVRVLGVTLGVGLWAVGYAMFRDNAPWPMPVMLGTFLVVFSTGGLTRIIEAFD